jgi:hypothetical protein
MPQDPIPQPAIKSPFCPNQEARKALFKSTSYIYIYIYIYVNVQVGEALTLTKNSFRKFVQKYFIYIYINV